MQNIADSEIIQETLHATPNIMINLYDKGIWPVDDKWDLLKIAKRATAYEVVDLMVEKTPRASMEQVKPPVKTSTKQQASAGKKCLQKKQVSESAKKVKVMKQIYQSEPVLEEETDNINEGKTDDKTEGNMDDETEGKMDDEITLSPKVRWIMLTRWQTMWITRIIATTTIAMASRMHTNTRTRTSQCKQMMRCVLYYTCPSKVCN